MRNFTGQCFFQLCHFFLLVVLALGIGLILATIAVKYRDVLHLYSVLMAVLMYLTPVIYPMSILRNGYTIW